MDWPWNARPHTTGPERYDGTPPTPAGPIGEESGAGAERPSSGRRRPVRRAVAIGTTALLVVGAGSAFAVSRDGAPAAAAANPTSWAGLIAAGNPTSPGPTSPGVAGIGAPARLAVDQRVAGTLQQLDAESVTIVDDQGDTRTWPLSEQASTAYQSEAVQDWLQQNDLVGQRVVVALGEENNTTVALFVRPAVAHVLGTVTAVDGDTYTVRSMAGFTHQVNVGGVADPPAVATGDQVLAVGTVADDGVTLLATQVTVDPSIATMRERWGGQPGQPGQPGWRGGPGAGAGMMSPGTGMGPGPRAAAAAVQFG